MKKFLFLSTPVGALGSGIGGGVELTIYNLVQEMQKRGYQITVIAPEGSKLPNTNIQTIKGNLHTSTQTHTCDFPITMPENSVLANMWEYARTIQGEYDLLVNFAFDWLPFYLTPFFDTPIAHLISMASLNSALDQIMHKIAVKYPHNFAVHSQAQAQTFPFADLCQCVGNGFDLSLYEFNPQPEAKLAWLGRIAPEKALEDAVKAVEITQIPLLIFGKIQDQNYWQDILNRYPSAPIEYQGFLHTKDLQQKLRLCQGVLMTPRWVEAFGNVAVEALACGVPVITYARGGPAEIIEDGKTGFLVEPDNINGLVSAIKLLPQIDRYYCRYIAEQKYSLKVWGDRMEKWFTGIQNNLSSR